MLVSKVGDGDRRTGPDASERFKPSVKQSFVDGLVREDPTPVLSEGFGNLSRSSSEGAIGSLDGGQAFGGGRVQCYEASMDRCRIAQFGVVT